MKEETFHTYLLQEEYALLSEYLTYRAFSDIKQRRIYIHPYLRRETKLACEEVLRKHRDKTITLKDYMRGISFAAEVVILALS
ncbi:MAG: hypothetical protein ACFB0B_18075 [Thermonemataceae bacterium]